MLTGIIKNLFLILVGLIFVTAAAVIYFRAKNVNRTERVQIFKTAEYFNAWLLLICFILTMGYGVFNHFEAKN